MNGLNCLPYRKLWKRPHFNARIKPAFKSFQTEMVCCYSESWIVSWQLKTYLKNICMYTSHLPKTEKYWYLMDQKCITHNLNQHDTIYYASYLFDSRPISGFIVLNPCLFVLKAGNMHLCQWNSKSHEGLMFLFKCTNATSYPLHPHHIYEHLNH